MELYMSWNAIANFRAFLAAIAGMGLFLPDADQLAGITPSPPAP